MRISTRMALGRTMLKPLAGHFHERLQDQDGDYGCALGMVSVAAPGDWNRLYDMMCKLRMTIPCGCTGIVYGSGMERVPVTDLDTLVMVIVHLFNDHVMTRKDWTMDQLIDWVRSVEPPNPEEMVSESEERNDLQNTSLVHSAK